MGKPAILVQNVTTRSVFARFALEVHRNETVLMCGGDTDVSDQLLSLIVGEQRPVLGSVFLLGQEPCRLQRWERRKLLARCGVVTERGMLVSNLSVFDNIALAARYHDLMPEDALSNRIHELLEAHGMAGQARLRPHELSMAESRLVALLRAVLHRPDVLVLEDIFEGMEEVGYDHVLSLLRTAVQDHAALLVTTKRTRLATSFDGSMLRLPNVRVESWAA